MLEAKEQELLRLRHDLKNQLLEFDVKLEGKHDVAYQDAKGLVNDLLKKCEGTTGYTANLPEMMVFALGYSVLRSNAGGFHMATHKNCFVFSVF